MEGAPMRELSQPETVRLAGLRERDLWREQVNSFAIECGRVYRLILKSERDGLNCYLILRGDIFRVFVNFVYKDLVRIVAVGINKKLITALRRD